MTTRSVKTLDEWNALLGGYGENVLFRGQDKHFKLEGKPSITTSFKRKGCHPPLMQKWTHYCSEILASLLGPNEKELPGIEFTQALLQHYGFRSFYIDVTSDVSVAAWFACNVYSSEKEIFVEEDCNETGLFVSVQPPTRHSPALRSLFASRAPSRRG